MEKEEAAERSSSSSCSSPCSLLRSLLYGRARDDSEEGGAMKSKGREESDASEEEGVVDGFEDNKEAKKTPPFC